MYTQFEEKGKIFTNVISKNPIEVIIQTTTHRIRAKLHVRPEGRIKDEMDVPEEFLALTEATIYENNGQQLYASTFLTVNRSAIVWLIPAEELKQL